ncbi:MAG: DUF2851 family protein [Lentisphaerae bacterium]|nr:DUF2851 family protein [Lentisphaerota bacterium]
MPPVKRRKTAPAAACYRAWRSQPAPALREAAWRRLDALTERHLQSVWYDPQFRPASLTTCGGERVSVLSAGRWNLSAGPDFLDACLVVGPERRTLRGDVELHIHPEDWTHHAHARDPLYRGVIAHVTYWPGRLPDNLLPAGAIQLALKPVLDADPDFYFECIDVTAYPYAVPARDGVGPAPPLAGYTPEAATALLAAAGEERLRLKAESMRAHLERVGPRQALFEGLLAALGYQHNRGAGRRLARIITIDRLEEEAAGRPLSAYALLLGVAGLMPNPKTDTWDAETRRFVRSLWDVWWKMQSRWEGQCLPRQAWRLAGIRPQNHPVRRLAAAAALFTATPPLEQALRQAEDAPPDVWIARAAALMSADDAIPYWKHRLAIGGKRRDQPVALLGAARQATIIANVLVPFLAASGGRTQPLLAVIPPEDMNQIHRQTAHLVFGPNFNPTLAHRGLQQQGLLQLFHDFCLTNRLDALAEAADDWRQAPTA